MRLTFPLATAMLLSTLIALRISGTSVGMYRFPGVDPDLLAGTPRPIRGDEWMNRTPNTVAQILNGNPVSVSMGVGSHDLTIVGDLPTRNWPILFRPDNLPALFLSPEHAVAWAWWFSTFAVLVGVYALVLALTGKVWVSSTVALLVGVSPLMEWWHLDISLCTVGYLCGAGAAFLAALRQEGWRAAALVALSSYLAVAAFLVFYPPWQISTALVAAPAVMATAAAWTRDGTVRLNRLLTCVAVVVGIFGTVVLLFLRDFHDTFTAITGTVYPGDRKSSGGEGSWVQILSSPFSPLIASTSETGAVGNTNQSEISSPFLLLVPGLLLMPRVLRHHERGVRWGSAALTGSAVVLFAWTVFPIPSGVGQFLLLDRVPSFRSVLGVGLAGALLFGLALGHGRKRSATLRVLTLNAVITAAAGIAGAMLLRRLSNEFAWTSLAACVVLWILVSTLLLLRRPTVAVLCASGVAVLTLTTINPLYRGLGALRSSDVLARVSEARQLDEGASWATYTGQEITSLVVATGVPVVTAVNYYPDAEGWDRLLGRAEFERESDTWNRYSNQLWGDGGNEPNISLIQADAVHVSVSPCSPKLAENGVGFVVWPMAAPAPGCLDLLSTFNYKGHDYGVFRIA